MSQAAPSRKQLLRSIATRIADYREGEIAPRTEDDVDRWVKQFAPDAQADILAEMDHVLSNLYISREGAEAFITAVVTHDKLAAPSPKKYWKSANVLAIQSRGESQKRMLGIMDKVLQKEVGHGLNKCGSEDGPCLYVDDCVFTGNHVRWDVSKWITDSAPKQIKMEIVVLAYHAGRLRYVEQKLNEAARSAGKSLDLRWWRLVALRDWYSGGETSCLHPTSFPDGDPHVAKLLNTLSKTGHPARARTSETTATNETFSSEDRRRVLESEFLKAGCRIKYELCTHLQDNQWPLGYDILKSPGFGSLLVTFRNCPNNCPLALWAGDPWFPLFPRRTNTDSSASALGEIDFDQLLR